MSPILRAASYAAIGISVLAAAVEAAPSFASRDDLQAASAPQIVRNDPAFPVSNAQMPLDVPLDGTEVTASADPVPEAPRTLAAMVNSADTASPLSAEEECLAGAIYFESRSESLEGQHAVADVIINRAESGRFAPTLCGVVHQRGQFSFVRGGKFPPIARGSRDWREAVAIARIAQADRWDSAAPNALFFHATHVAPRWKLRRVGTVGNHVFYR